MTLKEKLKLLADIGKRNDQRLKEWLAKKKA